MKITKPKILIACALLFMTAPTQALQPEVLYAFPQEPEPHASLVQGNDGHLYGTTEFGGSSGKGNVFQVTTNGVLTTLVSFNGTNGANPYAGLVLGTDGNFYGTTSQGGTSSYGSYGTVFRVTTNGVLTTLVSFGWTNGADPFAGLFLGTDGNFYGTTAQGGSHNRGTVFKVTTNGVLTSLASFTDTDGRYPLAELALGNDGNFYGTTVYGSSGENGEGNGTVFRVTTNGALTTLVLFTGINGANPHAGLVLGTDGNFYGTTVEGGAPKPLTPHGFGTVFKVTHDGVLTSLVSFSGDNGIRPYGGLVLGRDGSFYGTSREGGSGGVGTVFRVTTNGVLTTLVSFNLANGASPKAGLLLGTDGNFYGLGVRTVFRVTPSGVLTSLVSFTENGATPQAGLVLGTDGHFYGTTEGGGSGGVGTVFKVTTNGVLTTLVSFNGTNGAGPQAELVLGRDGNFYGTTESGGSNYKHVGDAGSGTVFRVTPDGVLTSLVSFNGANGSYPQSGLVLGSDGNLYGTTSYNGERATVFKVTTNGVLTTLVSLNGANPNKLVLGRDGHFYGTTVNGGTNIYGTVFRVTSDGLLTSLISFGAQLDAGLVLGDDGDLYGTTWSGTVFKVTTNGVLTTLVSFNGTNCCPFALKEGLIMGRDGHFYGTTVDIGNHIGPGHPGTVFRVTTNGVLTTLAVFDPDTSGAVPNELVLGADGYFYGTTTSGGPGGGGMIFRLVISAFTSVARQPGGSVLLIGTGPANGSYRLWASADLSSPPASWTLLTSASFDSNGNFSYTDAEALTNSSRFYRLSVP